MNDEDYLKYCYSGLAIGYYLINKRVKEQRDLEETRKMIKNLEKNRAVDYCLLTHNDSV